MSLCEKINDANTLGRTNLAEKGVIVPETATTYEIMQKIKDVSNGSGQAQGIMKPSTEEASIEATTTASIEKTE